MNRISQSHRPGAWSRKIASLGIALAALCVATPDASAGGRNAGSLLIYPEFDNRYGMATIITITNTSKTTAIDAHFVARGRKDQHGDDLCPTGGFNDMCCQESNFNRRLTPNDTHTAFSRDLIFSREQGYLYVYAQAPPGASNAEKAVVFNHLIGQVLSVDGIEALHYSVNAVSYTAPGNEGDPTDEAPFGDGDNIRDLDGNEYEKTAKEIQIPRFLGTGSRTHGELILIALSGGSQFTHTVDFWVYNSNRQPFSTQYSFRCWDKVDLDDISGVFDNSFLTNNSSNPDSNEYLGSAQYPIAYGWMRIKGGVASSPSCTIMNPPPAGEEGPAIYAVYIERLMYTAAADLPFEEGLTSGHLLPMAVTGDNSECQ